MIKMNWKTYLAQTASIALTLSLLAGITAQAAGPLSFENTAAGMVRLSLEKAKELVLAQLGLTTATFCDHEYDLEDGVYEFEFIVDGVKYEYEVDANTGEVREADIEGNDDWNDRDDWDDWNEFDRPDEDDKEDDDLDEDDWDDLDDDDDDLGEDEDDRCEIDDDEDDLDEDDDDEDQDD